jgi:hypothetical protein
MGLQTKTAGRKVETYYVRRADILRSFIRGSKMSATEPMSISLAEPSGVAEPGSQVERCAALTEQRMRQIAREVIALTWKLWTGCAIL